MAKAKVTEMTHSLQTLQVYLYYRIVVSGLLMLMYISGVADNILGKSDGVVFEWTSIIYFVSCVGARIAFSAQKLQHSTKRISGLLFLDVAALLLMVHSSGGIDSGIGYLLVLSVAITSVFIRGQLAFAFAAFITLFILGETFYLFHDHNDLTRKLFSSGILCTLIFTTSTAFYYLTEKLRKSALEAHAQERRVKNLQNIAQNIVTRMQTGVVVLDNKQTIELMNDSAKQLLHLTQDEGLYGTKVENVPPLKEIMALWGESATGTPSVIYNLRPEVDLRINFSQLDSDGLVKSILYLEDHRAIKQYAQQIKLASLGKLSASIAHEIRNPLGSISHAAQLLNENLTMDDGDKRMTEIILNNSARVNEIVDNTLSISRRREPKPERIELNDWLNQYVNEYLSTHECKITLEIGNQTEKLIARCDPSQLRQVITNLVDNGIRYSRELTGNPELIIRTGLAYEDGKTFIEVIDFGLGIPDDKINQIYEPFYTTDDSGTGLGLYISRELCEINHATLHYHRTENGNSCFRIDFPHHQRVR